MKQRIIAPLNQAVVPEILEVEITSRFQIPAFTVVGLADREVAEARERVRAAIEASGWEFPQRKIVMNLSPADVRKGGTGLDLPMALAVLLESRPNSGPTLTLCAWGELSLDGRVRPAGHVLRTLHAAWQGGAAAVLLPFEDGAAATQGLRLLEAVGFANRYGPPPRLHLLRRLSDWLSVLDGKPSPRITGLPDITIENQTENLALPTILAQAVGLAVAGQHHLYLAGPRGSGKSTAVDTLTRLLPPLAPQEELMRGLLQELAPAGTAVGRVIRVGQTVRPQALVGSLRAAELRPGSFSFAHGGVLLADELPEWNRDAIESLREPLERGSVSLTRVDRSVTLPARFLLAATGNLCPCGGEPESWRTGDATANATGPDEGEAPLRCRCLPPVRTRYLQRLSGPILDRFDLVVPARGNIASGARMEVARIREQAHRARDALLKKWGALPGAIDRERLEQILKTLPSLAQDTALAQASSLRTRHKLLRVALTLAAWHGHPVPLPQHLREARFFRVQNLERL